MKKMQRKPFFFSILKFIPFLAKSKVQSGNELAVFISRTDLINSIKEKITSQSLFYRFAVCSVEIEAAAYNDRQRIILLLLFYFSKKRDLNFVIYHSTLNIPKCSYGVSHVRSSAIGQKI